ncbi:MAG: hypothetical protein IJA85_07795 [Clostridia bacterium]|nr:hypothetical protein [Clostridia bacterium]
MQLKACCKAADITPHRGVRLAGYPHYPRENTGAHDPLMATCLYLDDGKCAIALVTLDILFFSKKYADRVKAAITESGIIDGERVLFTCSHTHSGPWASGNPELEATAGDSEDIDEVYLARLLDTLTGLVIDCAKNAYPAKVAYGDVICGAEYGIGGNRREKGGLCDPRLCVLAVRDEADCLRGVICSYALHPTFLHEDSTVCTADYPYYLREKIKESHPDAVVGFAQSTSGDQSSRYFRQGQSFDEAARVGGIMGEKAVNLIESLTFSDDVKLGMESAEVELILRDYPPVEELEVIAAERKAEYLEKLNAGAPYLDVQNANLRMLGAEDLLGYAICVRDGKRIDLLHDEIPCHIGAVRIGDLAVAYLPGELFVQYGIAIKDRSAAAKTFVFELTNGCLPGYCCNEEALAEGTYEAGNSMLSPRFGEHCVDVITGLIDRLFGDDK